MRISQRRSHNMPSASCNHSRSRRKTPRALLHGVELWNRTSVRNDGQLAGAVRRHTRGEPAILNPGQWLPDRVQGLFCAIPLPAANRSTIRRCDAILHWCEQSLQRPSTHRHEASRPWLADGQVNYTFSRCMDAVSMAAFCNSPREEFYRRCRENWHATTVPVITTSGTISTRSTCIRCRSKCGIITVGYALNGWQISGTAFWHSGVPF